MACQTEHSFCEDITWEKVQMQLIWVPLASQGALAIIIPCIGLVLRGQVKFRTVFVSGIYVAQLVLSLTSAGLWANRTYSYRVTSLDHFAEQFLCYFFLFVYLMNALQSGFSWTYAWEAASICDVITISSVLCEFDSSKVPWIGWGYLRTFRALGAYEKLEKTGVLKDVNELQRMVIISGLRTWALTVCLGGTVKTLEILGDPEFIAKQEKMITTDMGDLSFVQVFYYMVVTMSTVGYGDFSPTTVLNRFWIIICIPVGVIFFGIELERLDGLLKWQNSGNGKYRARSGQPHVVVLGGGIARPSPLLSGFFKELYADTNLLEDDMVFPEVVMMSVHEIDDDIKDVFDNVPVESRKMVKYFVGNPMNPGDLERVKVGVAQLVYIIPDTSAADRNAEDEGNILRAMAVKRAYPKVVMQLVLLLPRNVEKAVTCGIRRTRCCSLNNLKSSLLSTSCLCRGWTPLVINLVTSNMNFDEEEGDAPWFASYKRGCQMQIYSFAMRMTFVGDSFPVFAQKAMREGVLPIGFVIDGMIMLNPIEEKVKRGRICIAIAASRERLKNFEDETVNWKEDILESFEIFDKAMGTQTTFKQITSWQKGHAIFSEDTQDADELENLWFEFSEDAISKYNSLGEKIAAAGSHIILALLAEDIWSQARSFVRELRGPMLPLEMPILLLVPNVDCVVGSAAREVFAFSNVGFLAGSPARLSDLQRAGLSQARCTVILAGGAKVDPQVAQIAESEGWTPEVDMRMADCATVISLSSIEKFYEISGGLGRPVIAEILNYSSLQLMSMDPVYVNAGGSVNRRIKELDADEYAQEMAGDDVEDQPESFYLHPRFASGGLYVMGCFGALIAETYYNPGILSIMRSLILAQESQKSCPWCVSVPEKFVGRQYGDLVSTFIHDPWFALCLGLYRQRIPGYSSSACYVLTNPPHSTNIELEDRVIALGPASFGARCLQQGLLKPQQDAPRPEKTAMPTVAEKNNFKPKEDPSAPLLAQQL